MSEYDAVPRGISAFISVLQLF